MQLFVNMAASNTFHKSNSCIVSSSILILRNSLLQFHPRVESYQAVVGYPLNIWDLTNVLDFDRSFRCWWICQILTVLADFNGFFPKRCIFWRGGGTPSKVWNMSLRKGTQSFWRNYSKENAKHPEFLVSNLWCWKQLFVCEVEAVQ